MEANYTQANFQARVNVGIVRLYRHSDDITPSGQFVEHGQMLQTDATVDLFDGSTRLRIYEPDEYAGQWIDSGVCDLIPITVTEIPKESDNIVSIYVKSNNPIIYKTMDSQTPITSELRADSVLICDDRVEAVSNGINEVRYHIKSVDSEKDQNVVGYWILSNAKIVDPTTAKVIDIPTKVSTKKVDPVLSELNLKREAEMQKSMRFFAARDKTDEPALNAYNKIDINAGEIDPVTGLRKWEAPVPEYTGDGNMTAEEIAASVGPTEAATNPGNYEVPNNPTVQIDMNDPIANLDIVNKYTNTKAITGNDELAQKNDSVFKTTHDQVETAVYGGVVYVKEGAGHVIRTHIVDPVTGAVTAVYNSGVVQGTIDAATGVAGLISDGAQFMAGVASGLWDGVTGGIMHNDTEPEDTDEDYNYYAYNYNYDSETMMSIPIERLNYVHGLPFQYTYITDRRIGAEGQAGSDDECDSSDKYGRTFAQEILSNTPIIVFAPGEPTFMSAVKTQGILGAIKSAIHGNSSANAMKTLFTTDNEDDVKNLLDTSNGNYDYFSMEVKTAEYFKYVNSMCRLTAKNMGLGNRRLGLSGGKTTCDKVDWGEYSKDVDWNTGIHEILGLDGGVSFAYDPQSSVTDSISTSTGDSQLAGLLNQASSTVREINFVMGATAGKQFLNYSPEEFAETSNQGAIGSVLSRLSDIFNNTVSGMNVRFPEIWQDSSSSKDYSIDMRFVAPYATPFCIWRYVLVPFIHIFCLAAPRSTSRVNSYTSPFLIRAFSKGYLNIEMGMITSLSWRRFGDGDMISADGLPTQIDVSVDLKDLYHTLSMSPWKTSNLALFFNNTGLIDMLGTLSGVNMNRISLTDRLSLYGFAFNSSISSIETNLMRHVNDRVRNVFDRFLNVV